jgi:ATP/maltotriose-dependent transcriptional regulator MalT
MFEAALDLAGDGLLLAFGCVPRQDLTELIAQLPSASSLLSRDVLARLPDVFPANISVIKLSNQERAVLKGLARGQRAGDVAGELFLAVSTVKTHQRHLYRKLGVNSREQALTVAAGLGLLT